MIRKVEAPIFWTSVQMWLHFWILPGLRVVVSDSMYPGFGCRFLPTRLWIPRRDCRPQSILNLPLFGSFQKSGALIETPNSRALIARTPTKSTHNLWKRPFGFQLGTVRSYSPSWLGHGPCRLKLLMVHVAL